MGTLSLVGGSASEVWEVVSHAARVRMLTVVAQQQRRRWREVERWAQARGTRGEY